MKIELKVSEGDVRVCEHLYADAEYVVPTGECPQCKAKPWAVSGGTPVVQGHDTQTAPAWTRCCGKPAGSLVVTVSTLFGIEEDERVLHGRCRVY